MSSRRFSCDYTTYNVLRSYFALFAMIRRTSRSVSPRFSLQMFITGAAEITQVVKSPNNFVKCVSEITHVAINFPRHRYQNGFRKFVGQYIPFLFSRFDPICRWSSLPPFVIFCSIFVRAPITFVT